MTQEIFIVDDEFDIRTIVKDILIDEGYTVRDFSNADEFLCTIEEKKPILVLLDIWLKGSSLDGVELLEKIKQIYPELAVVMISGHGNVEIAVSCIKKGAYDFIEKPFNSDRLLLVVSRALQNVKLILENKKLQYQNKIQDIIFGATSKACALKNSIEKAAATASRIMIYGNAGAGKEIVARSLHYKSDRADKPFVIFNCACVNSYSLEMEMLDAFKQAAKGTIVLDEIADLSLVLQAKLLKIIQDKNQNILNDVRIITITSHDIKSKINQGLFREDLFYRLNVIPINVPALSECKDDIILYANYFMKQYCDLKAISFKGFSEQAITALRSYEWSGKIRQLRNTMEWISIMLEDKLQDNEVTLDMLPIEIYSNKSNLIPELNYNNLLQLPIKEARELFEKDYLEKQLKYYDSISKVADVIGMERTALHRKLKSLGINYKK